LGKDEPEAALIQFESAEDIVLDRAKTGQAHQAVVTHGEPVVLDEAFDRLIEGRTVFDIHAHVFGDGGRCGGFVMGVRKVFDDALNESQGHESRFLDDEPTAGC
jgi:hypothetical protein